jgi:hypothetical protein
MFDDFVVDAADVDFAVAAADVQAGLLKSGWLR